MPAYENSQAANYLKSQIETASPTALILMLYDGALKFLKRARIGFSEMDFEIINNSLVRTQAIVSELMLSLDMEQGGEIARNLFSLYVFINKNLSLANVEKEEKHLAICEELLGKLRETWDEMMKREGLQMEKKEGMKKPVSRLNLAV